MMQHASATVPAPGRRPELVPDPDAEAARIAAVRRYDILDTPPDGAFDRVAAMAARLFDVPVATVTIVDSDRIWFKAAHGLEGVKEIGRDPGLCGSAILRDDALVIPDTLRDPVAADNPLVAGEMGVRFYAAAPIITPDGHRLGTVNILDTKPRSSPRTTPPHWPISPHRAGRDGAAAVGAARPARRTGAAGGGGTAAREQAEQDKAAIAAFASTLQRTLLPPALPVVPGLELACHYRTASAHDVGGDFYDVFPLDGDRWAFFLGDVCGKGPEAATVTALARHTLRAAAQINPDPVTVLARSTPCCSPTSPPAAVSAPPSSASSSPGKAAASPSPSPPAATRPPTTCAPTTAAPYGSGQYAPRAACSSAPSPRHPSPRPPSP